VVDIDREGGETELQAAKELVEGGDIEDEERERSCLQYPLE